MNFTDESQIRLSKVGGRGRKTDSETDGKAKKSNRKKKGKKKRPRKKKD